MTLTLIHTAEVHRATFDTLRDRLAPDTPLHHIVREDWLARAQSGIDAALAAEITDEIKAASGPVICTCTTLGAVAEAAGATRIDRPMMQAAASLGGPVLMAYCLASTAGPSTDALNRAFADAGQTPDIIPLFLPEYWPLFEAGETTAFAAVIAAAIRNALADSPATCIVLAQASMAGAAPLLHDIGTPVLSSPELALRWGLSYSQKPA